MLCILRALSNLYQMNQGDSAQNEQFLSEVRQGPRMVWALDPFILPGMVIAQCQTFIQFRE